MAAPSASDMVVVVAGGEPVDPARASAVPTGAMVIAADSGVDQAHALGLHVDLAIGDFDSVSSAGLDRAADDGARLDRHPVDKDATDLELALDAAMATHPRRIHVLGGAGGRLDHLLANALLLTAPTYAGAEVTAEIGAARLTVIRSSATLRGALGETVSLLPVRGPATGITTTGLAFPLRSEALAPGTSRGVSNRFADPTAHVALAVGVLLAVQPNPSRPLFEEIAP